MKKLKVILIAVIICAIAASIAVIILNLNKTDSTQQQQTTKIETLKVDISEYTFEKNSKQEDIKVYTQEQFNDFYNDFSNDNLPEVYITEFLFDGASMYKTYSLDDFIENGNNTEIDPIQIDVVNINTTNIVELSGDIIGGMVAVNTNNKKGDINIVLNGVYINTDSKKVPAVYVYNKDINYTDCKVNIELAKDSENIIKGGKLKKVSLVPSNKLSEYADKYSGTNKENFENYTSYYGVYTQAQIDKVLFAKIEADREDLNDGDPVYFYKAAGAISSDIDLYFSGEGSLKVVSNCNEGIETKGNLTLGDGKGNYVIHAEDDCLNTTTDATNARNTLTIDVDTLTAIVSETADEGDTVDSNGSLIINGGTVIALACPGQDFGLDANDGVYINGGTILATGDMADEISEDSTQIFTMLSFYEKIQNEELITLLDENDNPIFAYKTDRNYSKLLYSSSDLDEATYYLYKNGNINGENTNGFYTNINSYEKGTQLAYSYKGSLNPQFMTTMKEPQERMDDNLQMPNGDRPTPPEDMNREENITPPQIPEGQTPPDMNDMTPPDGFNQIREINYSGATREFVIDDVANIFNDISEISE